MSLASEKLLRVALSREIVVLMNKSPCLLRRHWLLLELSTSRSLRILSRVTFAIGPSIVARTQGNRLLVGLWSSETFS